MINRYERLNQELKMVETKRKVAAYCRVSTEMKTKPIRLKANSGISDSILSAIPIGSFMRFLPMRAFLARIQRSVKSLTV